MSFLYTFQVGLSVPTKIKGMQTAVGKFAAYGNVRQQRDGSRDFTQSFDTILEPTAWLGYRF